MPHHALLHILATTRRHSRGCVHRNITFFRTPSELSSGTCGMRSSYCHQCHIHNRKDFHHVLICMSMIPHKITPFHISINGGILEYSSKTAPNLYHIWVQDACLQVVDRQGASQNFWKFSSLSIILFWKISNQHLVSKQYKKVVWKIFK